MARQNKEELNFEKIIEKNLHATKKNAEHHTIEAGNKKSHAKMENKKEEHGAFGRERAYKEEKKASEKEEKNSKWQ